MKINIFSKMLIVFLLTNLAISCVKDTDYELPDTTTPVPKFDGTIKSVDDVVGITTDKVTEYQDNDALEGYVISSDEGGNFYKKIYVENAEKTQGFAIAIDKGGLYSEFPLGAKVQIRLKGLSVQLVDGQLEIGYKTHTKSGRVSVGNMPSNIYKNHFYNLQEELKNKGELAKSSPSVEELKKKENVNLLLTFENVYFEKSAVGKSFHEKENDGRFGTNYNLIDSKGKKIEFRTSKFAKFKDEKVPNGLLKVTGILTTFKGSYQFLANNIDDIEVIGDIPNSGTTTGTASPTTTSGEVKTIKEISDLHKGSEVTISDNFVIKGVIISDNKNGNTNIKNAVIQDDTAGIILRFEKPHNFEFGKEVEVSLKGSKLTEKFKLLQIELSPSNVKVVGEKTLTPKVLTIAEINSGKYENQWVKIENVQFKETGKKYAEKGNALTDCTNELPIYVSDKYAKFKDETVSDKRGYIEGYISLFKGKPQLIINSTSDVHFTANRENCSNSTGGTTPPPSGGTTPPSGGTTPPSGGTTPPSGGTTPPSGGTTPPPSTTVSNIFNFEDIKDEDISNSYSKEGTLTSSDGKATLSFKGRTDMDKFAIEGKGIMMKKNGFIKITFSKGIKNLKFKYRGAYTSTSKRKVIILKGDENSSTILGEKEFAHDITPETFSLDLNETGSYTVTIKGGTDKQIVIDDIEWTN